MLLVDAASIYRLVKIHVWGVQGCGLSSALFAEKRFYRNLKILTGIGGKNNLAPVGVKEDGPGSERARGQPERRRGKLKNTGVFLSDVELTEMQGLAKTARTTPMFGLSSEQVLSGNDFASLAHKHMFARLTELAKVHGLPEISGEYGLTEKGEFLTV
jgi:hypothetical protein